MNWFQLVVNIFGVFAAGYGTAVAAGQPPKVAAGFGVGAIIANQTGLFQKQPHAN